MTPDTPGSSLEQELAAIWNRHLPGTLERIGRIENAGIALSQRSLTESARAEARESAHQLVGLCSTFDRSDLSRLARRAEQLLLTEDGDPHVEGAAVASIAAQLREAVTA